MLIYFQYTRKEIEWYGLTFKEACKKWIKLKTTQPQPLKIQYRSELIAKLKENKIKEAENVNVVSPGETYVTIYTYYLYSYVSVYHVLKLIKFFCSSWLNTLNPFSKNPKTE